MLNRRGNNKFRCKYLYIVLYSLNKECCFKVDTSLFSKSLELIYKVIPDGPPWLDTTVAASVTGVIKFSHCVKISRQLKKYITIWKFPGEFQ